MDFWQWLVNTGLTPSTDPTYYSQGRAQPFEYANALRTAVNAIRAIAAGQYPGYDPRIVNEFYTRLQNAGGLLATDNLGYYARGEASAAEFDNLIDLASGRLRQKATAPPPAPKPAPAPTPAPKPAPKPAPAPKTPATPKPPAATTPPPPKPIDYAARVAALYPFLPSSLVQMFADAWATTGDEALALAEVRASDAHAQLFPGIKRSDGSLRMTELEWFSEREAYSRLFLEFGLNPQVFEGRFTELMEGDVRATELAFRLGGAYEGLVTNIPEVKQAYAGWFGDGMVTDQALFAMWLDPNVSDAILNRRLSIAQVGGEGLARGFDTEVTEDFSTRLVQGGLNQASARQFFGEAEERLPTLDELVRRHHDPDSTFDLNEFADAAVFGDAAQGRRIKRNLLAEASLYSDRLGTIGTTEDLRVSGLSAR